MAPFLRRERVVNLHYFRVLRLPRTDLVPADCDESKLEIRLLLGVGRPEVEVEVEVAGASFNYRGGRTWVPADD